MSNSSNAAANANSNSNAVKRESYFTRFRNRWKRRGVIEIDETHSKYAFTEYVRQGLRDSLDSHTQVKESFCNADFHQKLERNLTSSNNRVKFRFVTYASEVFESLRQLTGFLPDPFAETVCSIEGESNYLEFLSNSKSGQHFFLTNNKQLMIKTHTASEKKFFLHILPKYMQHLKMFPHSLLVRYLGLYKIVIEKEHPIYFVIMQSILYPDERINKRFDLKACEAGRYTEENSQENCEIITVLKDLNFRSENIILGSQRFWFVSQIKHDTEFLRLLGVIDYSLLMGIQSLHLEEIRGNKELASIFVRARKSTSKQHSVLKNWAQSPSRRIVSQISEDQSIESQVHSGEQSPAVQLEDLDEYDLPGMVDDTTSSENYKSVKIQKSVGVTETSETPSTFMRGTSGEESNAATTDVHSSATEEELLSQNRRLLPDCRNELHVIDGSDRERYFLGIIDFFTPYGIIKRCESAVKAIRYKPSGLTYSTVHPNEYAERFRCFINKHTI